MKAFSALLCVVLVLIGRLNAFNVGSAEEDRIGSLPGLDGPPSFAHFSGYLQVSETGFLHYWFVESQGNPSSDPLMFWFTGGPGCSSLYGLLTENGPYVLDLDGKALTWNPHAWNKLANVVYLESPVGVGFSFDSNGNTTTDDDLTSLRKYTAIKEFMEKFPKFRNHPLYLTGESYSGIYIPTLAVRIIEGQKDFKVDFKGIAIGNGMMDYDLNDNTLVHYLLWHGLIDNAQFISMAKSCCPGTPRQDCKMYPMFNIHRRHLIGECIAKMSIIKDIQSDIYVSNFYDIYQDCSSENSTIYPHQRNRFLSQTHSTLNNPMLSSKQHQPVPDPCVPESVLEKYLNDPKVRKALNIGENHGEWTMCNSTINYEYVRIYFNMEPQINKIADANVNTLIYYGTTDTVNTVCGKSPRNLH